MEKFRTIIGGGMQRATATADGIEFTAYVIGGKPIDYKTIEAATYAATIADDMRQAFRDSLISSGLNLTGVDIIVTAAPVEEAGHLPSFSITAAIADAIDGHAIDMACILAKRETIGSVGELADHAAAINRLARFIKNKKP